MFFFFNKVEKLLAHQVILLPLNEVFANNLECLRFRTRVRVGELDLESNFETQHQEFIIIGIHAPLYYHYNAINDVALVTLSGDVQFNGENIPRILAQCVAT